VRGLRAGILGRLRLIYFYFVRKDVRDSVTFLEVLKAALASRCEVIASRFSKAIREDSEYVYYSIHGEENLFIYPKKLPYHNFAQVISEGCQREHWHYYEIPQARIEKGDVVVDCGSAEGFFAFQNLRAGNHLYCIEPLPVFCRALHKLFDDYDNVTIIEAALSDRNGKLYICPSSISSTCKPEMTDANNDILVEAVTIDSLFADKGIPINFLKADLEGFEEKMILGSLKTIQLFKPKIAVTTYHPGTDYNKIIHIIKQVVPEYQFVLKGVEELTGNPVMLHMWVK